MSNSTIYAIGDVHGCSDLLARLVDFIANHAQRNRRIPLIFFLGDIVDRGHHPLGAMIIVQDCIQRWPGSRLFCGNHEQMFLEVLDNPRDEHLKNRFIRNGGYNTLRSFIGYDDPHTVEEIADVAVRHAHHVSLMRRASLIEIVGRYAFVHAGIDPHVAIGEQNEKDMMWIREKFLDYVGPLSHIIVHGHTMLEPARPVVTENRISLDTGAYHSGVLSMAVIDPETDAVEFYATNCDGSVQAVEPVRLDRGFGDALTPRTSYEDSRVSEMCPTFTRNPTNPQTNDHTFPSLCSVTSSGRTKSTSTCVEQSENMAGACALRFEVSILSARPCVGSGKVLCGAEVAGSKA